MFCYAEFHYTGCRGEYGTGIIRGESIFKGEIGIKNQTCVEVVLAGVIGVSKLDEIGADVMVVVEVIAGVVIADGTVAVNTEVVVAVEDDIAVVDVEDVFTLAGVNVIKLFSSFADDEAKFARVFVPDNYFPV